MVKKIKNKIRRKSMGLVSSLFLALLSSLLLTLSFPEYDYYLLAFVAMVPIFIVVSTQGFFVSAVSIFTFVIGFYYGFLDWIEVFHPLALPGLVFYLCIIYFITFSVYRWMKIRNNGIYNVILITVIFVLFEFFREQGFAKFPYGVLAYSQYKFSSFIQISDIFGHLGISFCLYFVNASIADSIIGYIWGDTRFQRFSILFSLRRFLVNRYYFIVIIFILIISYGNYRLVNTPYLNDMARDSSFPKKVLKNDVTENVVKGLSWLNLLEEEIDNWFYKATSSSEIMEYKSQELKEDLNKANPLTNTVKISIVQPWFDFNLRWTQKNRDLFLNKLFTLSMKAAKSKPDLIIWPESSIPVYYEYELSEKRQNINSLSKQLAESYQSFIKRLGRAYPDIQLISGALSLGEINSSVTIENKKPETIKDAKTGSLSGNVKKYNSTLWFDNQANVIERSAKRYLVPVGEYFPYRELLTSIPWFASILKEAQASNFTPFEKFQMFNHKKGNFAVLICYEDTFFDLSRDYVLKGAGYIVVITNDAWSYTEKSQLIHYAFIPFRAIENQRYFVRSGNAGVTGLLDTRGREIGMLPQFVEGYTTVDVPVLKKLSFFTKYGNFFIIFLFGVFFLYNFAFILSKLLLLVFMIFRITRECFHLVYKIISWIVGLLRSNKG